MSVQRAASTLAGQQFAGWVVTEFQPSLEARVELSLGRKLSEREQRLALNTYERERLRLFEANRV